MSKSKSQDILTIIKQRPKTPTQTTSNKLRSILNNMGGGPPSLYEETLTKIINDIPPDDPTEDIPDAPLRANDWQEFKRKFCESYGEEKIQPTGMTHSEYIEYIKTSGWREGDEFEDDWYWIEEELREYRKEQSGKNFADNLEYAHKQIKKAEKRKKQQKAKINKMQKALKKQAKKDYKDPI